MYTFQRTLNQKIKLSGIGLHTGKNTNIVIKPSDEGTGINFKRVDFENHLIISANVDNVVETNRGTTIGKDGVKIYTIEHFLSALAGLGIDNAMVEIDNIEPPIFDGSSKPFIDMILEAGIKHGLIPKLHANELDFSGGIEVGVKMNAISVDHLIMKILFYVKI